MSVSLRYEPFPNTGQEAFWEACGWRRGPNGWFRDPATPRRRHVAFVGPAGIGKTMTGCAATIMNAFQFPANYLILAPVFQNHMKMTTLPEYKQRLTTMHRAAMRESKTPLVQLTADGSIYHTTDREIRLVPPRGHEFGSVLYFRGTEEPESLYGPNLGGFHADEAGLMTEDAITVIRARMRVPSGARQAIYTFTPKGSKKHWTNRDFGRQLNVAKERIEHGESGIGDDPEFPAFTMRLEDNTEVGEDYIKDQQRAAGQSRKGYQEYHGVWLDEGGLIYEQFNPMTHMRYLPQDTRFVRYAGGIDFGLSAPTVVVVVAEDSNGRYWWCREFYQRQCPDQALVGACRRYMEDFPGIKFFCDPHSPELIHRLRLNYIKAFPGSPEVNARVTLMWERLAVCADNLPGIYFTPECVESVDEMETWSWKASRSAGGIVRYDDVEPHAHCMDAGGYALVAMGKGQQLVPIDWGAKEPVYA